MKLMISILAIICNMAMCGAQTLNADVKIVPDSDDEKRLLVNVTVNKENIDGFLKFVQVLPANFSAEKIDVSGGNFVQSDTLLKIIWLSPPVENVFRISYSIVSPDNTPLEYKYKAKIDYLVGPIRKVFEFTNVSFFIGEQKQQNIVSEEKTTEVVEEATEKNEVLEPSQEEEVKSVPPPTMKEVIQEVPKPIIENRKEEPTGVKVRYCVQIGAYISKPKVLGVSELHVFEMRNGITKYLSGNFKSYEEAEVRKNELLQQGFDKTYIVILKDGVPIN